MALLSRKTAAHAAGLLLLSTLCIGTAHGAARAQSASEVELKSAFLFKFTHFTEWPEGALGGEGEPLRMCVIGNASLFQVLQTSVQGRMSQARPVEVQLVSSSEAIGNCHVLFIGLTDATRIDSLLAALANRPILTVGDRSGFAHDGGMINFVRDDSRLRFEINRDAVTRAGLLMSSQLLKLATLVE